jgi:hypothetical protein
MKGVIATIVAVAVLLALDKYCLDGRYTDAALAMLSEIRRGFGLIWPCISAWDCP